MVIGTFFFLYAVLYPDAGMAAGLYLRGAVGYEWSMVSDFSDTDCTSANSPALFGCANGNDGKPIGAYGNFGHFPLPEAAVGWQFLPWLRADLAVAYRFNMNYGSSGFYVLLIYEEKLKPQVLAD